MRPLAVDDPVTVLDETGKLLVQARWNGDGAHVYRYGTAGRVNMPNTALRLADEGVTWVRGHVTGEDNPGKALLVAAALAPEKPRLSATDEALVAAGSLLFLGMKYVFKRLKKKRDE